LRVVLDGIPVVIDNDGSKEYISIWINNKMVYTRGVWSNYEGRTVKRVYDEFTLRKGDVLTVIGRVGDDFFKAKLECCSKRGVVLWIGSARISIIGVKVSYFYTTNSDVAGYKVVRFKGGGDKR